MLIRSHCTMSSQLYIIIIHLYIIINLIIGISIFITHDVMFHCFHHGINFRVYVFNTVQPEVTACGL